MAVDVDRVQMVFAAAAGLSDPAGRAEFLDQECGDDAELRRRIELLLGAHDDSGGLPGAGLAATGVDELGRAEETVVAGRYKLLELIGEGGMGAVWVAKQTEPIKRRVALKLIKSGMDSRSVLQRFEAERQALAVMDHPNIARVFDGGLLPDGRPFFAMELVNGLPINRFCDDAKLSTEERLGLFVKVCQAVQHAHQKGIIHRDLKPANVLVTIIDGRPEPKVIDFGVAKAMSGKLHDRVETTQFGAVIGTLEYMAPEQAGYSGTDIDTRADVYALGVILYELLTGLRPFDSQRLKQAALDEVIRIIREEEPSKPSTRLSSSESLPSSAAARHTEPKRLLGKLRGDLDWIALKCLEKDRNRRYETATALAADVQRHLADDVVEARPPSAGYRLRKFTRKYRTPLRFACVIALLLVGGVFVSTWQAFRATTAEKAARQSEEAADSRKLEAEEAREKAEKRRDELARLKYIADLNLARHAWDANNLVRARQLLDQYLPQAGEPDLRGFEWYYLDRLFHGDLLTLKAYSGVASTAVFSPDGKRLYTVGKTTSRQALPFSVDLPGEIKLWDAASGRRLPLTLQGPAENAMRIALSPDGARLAAGCGRHGIWVWNLTTGQSIHFETHAGELDCDVGFSPDGKRLSSQSLSVVEGTSIDDVNGVVRIWDLAAGKVVATFDHLFNCRHAPAFSPDGKHVAVVNFLERLVRVVDAATGQERFTLKCEEGFLSHAVFSPDGASLAAGGERGPTIWDVATHQRRFTCPSVTHMGGCLAYSPDGKSLAMAGLEGLIELWDARTGQKINTFKGHAGDVSKIAFDPMGGRLASAGADGGVRLWDVAGRGDAIPILNKGVRLGYADISPDGQSMVVENVDDKRYYLVDAATGARRGGPIDSPNESDCFDWSADGRRLIAPGVGKTIAIYDVGSEALVHSFNVERATDCVVAISPDGRWFAHSDPAGTIRILSAETGAERRSITGLTALVHNLAFSPDGSRLAGADEKGWVKVWELATGREVMSSQVGDVFMMRIRFNADGSRLAVAGNHRIFRSGEARLLDVESGRETTQLRGHTILVTDVAFTPDGRRMATSSADHTVRLWDATTGQELLMLSGHTQSVFTVRFLSNGCRLISASWDRTVRTWDATPLPE